MNYKTITDEAYLVNKPYSSLWAGQPKIEIVQFVFFCTVCSSLEEPYSQSSSDLHFVRHILVSMWQYCLGEHESELQSWWQSFLKHFCLLLQWSSSKHPFWHLLSRHSSGLSHWWSPIQFCKQYLVDLEWNIRKTEFSM